MKRSRRVCGGFWSLTHAVHRLCEQCVRKTVQRVERDTEPSAERKPTGQV